MRIGCFISPHGFGHATRVTAVLEQIQIQVPELICTLFTTVPENIFTPPLHRVEYIPICCDVGLIQPDALEADILATINRLEQFYTTADEQIAHLASQVKECTFILCDIAPLGIEVARRAARPVVLLENFTWDWIYEPYADSYPGITPFINRMHDCYQLADYHLQTEPVCLKQNPDLICPPISRTPQISAQTIRARLGVDVNQSLILISLGGIPFHLDHLDKLQSLEDYFFIVAGQNTTSTPAPNMVTLQSSSEWYHPDLVNAADLVLCKSGYSTIAECIHCNTRIGCVKRQGFRESIILEQYIQQQLYGTLLEPDQFRNGSWIDLLPAMMSQPPPSTLQSNGAAAAAQYLLQLYNK